jgi:hypothetical protein
MVDSPRKVSPRRNDEGSQIQLRWQGEQITFAGLVTSVRKELAQVE